MPEITLRHEFDCDEDTFWNRTFFDDEFNRRLYAEALKFPGYKILDRSDTPEKLTRRIHVDPPMDNVAAPVRKVIGDKLSYVEDGMFDKKSKRYSFKIVPSSMADKIKNVGEMWCETRGEKKIERFAKFNIEVKVFMIGGMIEEHIVTTLRRSYDTAADFTRKFLKERG